MDPLIASAAISAGSSLLGGLLGGGSNNHAGRDQRQATSYAIRASVLDKVAAAKEAGISPLYALGAPVMSASSAVGSPGNSNLGQTISNMGQDISRAVAAQQTDIERKIQGLTLDKAALENEYLRAQIASLRARTIQQVAPPIGPVTDATQELSPPQMTPKYSIGPFDITSNPYAGDAQTRQNRSGDSEIADMIDYVMTTPMDLYWTIMRAVSDDPGYRKGNLLIHR